ncbi:hypothetical protein Pan44_37470 [Caulifigura coniformis]|uniref:Uncharacterized protein n=2 Tax=Caulifigura coniformis TaxID=2527983 RepID=A0A517SHV6_9PLAN|nr:hypothetical protein Pan44_37470 [Caulifigura coniformis]
MGKDGKVRKPPEPRQKTEPKPEKKTKKGLRPLLDAD